MRETQHLFNDNAERADETTMDLQRMETKEGWVTRGKHFESKFTCYIKFNKFISKSTFCHKSADPLWVRERRAMNLVIQSCSLALHPPYISPWASARPIVAPLQGSELLRTFICRLIFEAMFAPFSNRFGSHIGPIVASVSIIFALFPR